MNRKNEEILNRLTDYVVKKDNKCDAEIARFCINHLFHKKRNDICPEQAYKLTYGCEHAWFLKKQGKKYGFLIQEYLSDTETHTIEHTVYTICNAANIQQVVNKWQHNCDVSKELFMRGY